VINAPNPFNPAKQSTKIQFYADQAENVKIKIYTLNGKLVFEDSFSAVAGTNEYEYKGKDGNGNYLYNGVYVCVVEKSGGNAKCKIAVVK
jgi:flagellar hook assembly protein FlgD